MRPVNLIPPEERPGGRKPLRAGPLAYIVVGALAAAVIAVTVLVVSEGKVSEQKAEVVRLEQEQASISAKAQSLSSYTQFTTVREQRLATVTSLATSRFDWSRVLHELSLVVPPDVQLTNLAGSGAPGDNSGGAGLGMRNSVAGPALEVIGCATRQSGVAGFIEALKQIDGVTRVGVQGSVISSESSGGNATAASTCGKKTAAQFQIVVAFDAAPVPPADGAEEVAPEPTTTESTEGESGESSESSESSESTETTSEEPSAEGGTQ
jgi:Tfp pilus assembly protein PilN